MGDKFKDPRNLSLLMDAYEMTIANALYMDDHATDRVVFDVFFRKNPDDAGFSIFAGLEQILDYVQNFHLDEEDIAYLEGLNMFSQHFIKWLANTKFNTKITGFAEGSICFPNEPLLTIEAEAAMAQLIETYILNQVNHQSLIATKANRIVRAAKGRGVADFGARRAHGADAALYGARASYIGGVNSTATLLAGKMFEIPVSGTMAHSYVMIYGEEEAFMQFADTYPDACILLIDTYDTLKLGLPHAISTFRYLIDKIGRRPKLFGVRIDSGDLAYLSKEVRKGLDAAGFYDAKIVVSNSLDEYTIDSLLEEQHAPIDSFGVGENMITSRSCPVFGAVYKLAARLKADYSGGFIVEPKIKLSNTVEKITNPGLKTVYRLYNKDGYIIGDVISGKPEFDISEECINPEMPWQTIKFKDVTAKKMTIVLYSETVGMTYVTFCPIEVIRGKVKEQIEKELWPEVKRFRFPHQIPVYHTKEYHEMKTALIQEELNRK